MEFLEMLETLLTGEQVGYVVALGVITYFIMQTVKKTLVVQKNYLPALAIVVGVVVSFLSINLVDMDMVTHILVGVLAGSISTHVSELIKFRDGDTNKNKGDVV